MLCKPYIVNTVRSFASRSCDFPIFLENNWKINEPCLAPVGQHVLILFKVQVVFWIISTKIGWKNSKKIVYRYIPVNNSVIFERLITCWHPSRHIEDSYYAWQWYFHLGFYHCDQTLWTGKERGIILNWINRYVSLCRLSTVFQSWTRPD